MYFFVQNYESTELEKHFDENISTNILVKTFLKHISQKQTSY